MIYTAIGENPITAEFSESENSVLIAGKQPLKINRNTFGDTLFNVNNNYKMRILSIGFMTSHGIIANSEMRFDLLRFYELLGQPAYESLYSSYIMLGASETTVGEEFTLPAENETTSLYINLNGYLSTVGLNGILANGETIDAIPFIKFEIDERGILWQ